MLIARVRLLIASLWVGSLWTIGALVAPMLFTQLSDRVLAGTIAGSLFGAEAWLSVVCALVLLGLQQWRPLEDKVAQRRILLLTAAMLVCTLLGYFALHPWMAALREAAGPAGIAASADRATFGMLHGLSSALYFIQGVLGLLLLIRLKEVG